jgi:hypothetical protein
MGALSRSVLEASQRAWQYWFADGLMYVLTGVAMLSMSICLLYAPPLHAFWRQAFGRRCSRCTGG